MTGPSSVRTARGITCWCAAPSAPGEKGTLELARYRCWSPRPDTLPRADGGRGRALGNRGLLRGVEGPPDQGSQGAVVVLASLDP